jgi:hypothetical protein
MSKLNGFYDMKIPEYGDWSVLYENVLLSTKQWAGEFAHRQMTENDVPVCGKLIKDAVIREKVYVSKEERGDVSITPHVVSIRGTEYPRFGRSVIDTISWAFSDSPVQIPYTKRAWIIPCHHMANWEMSAELQEIGKKH